MTHKEMAGVDILQSFHARLIKRFNGDITSVISVYLMIILNLTQDVSLEELRQYLEGIEKGINNEQ